MSGTTGAIEVHLPQLLRESVGGAQCVTVTGHTLVEALDRLWCLHPPLRVHLQDEEGRQRPHVLLFYNGRNLATLGSLEIPLHSGDRLDVVQAVSGG